MPRYARVAVVVLIQLGILAAVPARQIRARRSGTPITLRTVPFDPFDLFAGHYVTLSYEVERPPDDAALDLGLRDGEDVWLTVQRGEPAWTFVSISRQRPAGASGQVSIRAYYTRRWNPRGWAEIYGARRFYVTEGQGAAVDAARRGRETGLVDLRIGKDGTPAITAVRFAGMVLKD